MYLLAPFPLITFLFFVSIPIAGSFLGNRKGKILNSGLVIGVALGVTISIGVLVIGASSWKNMNIMYDKFKDNSWLLPLLFLGVPIIGGTIGGIFGTRVNTNRVMKSGALVGLITGYIISILLFGCVFFGFSAQ